MYSFSGEQRKQFLQWKDSFGKQKFRILVPFSFHSTGVWVWFFPVCGATHTYKPVNVSMVNLFYFGEVQLGNYKKRQNVNKLVIYLWDYTCFTFSMLVLCAGLLVVFALQPLIIFRDAINNKTSLSFFLSCICIERWFSNPTYFNHPPKIIIEFHLPSH